MNLLEKLIKREWHFSDESKTSKDKLTARPSVILLTQIPKKLARGSHTQLTRGTMKAEHIQVPVPSSILIHTG